MENGNKIFKKNKYELEYKVFGTGENKILVFHGFGQSNNIVKLMGGLYNDYTVLSVNLFYHSSKSFYNNDLLLEPISIKEFVDIHESLLAFVFPNEKKYSVLGYSIGGRLASVFVANTNKHIDELFLIAPDGYQVSFFYWLVTYTRLGLFMYYKTMEYAYGFKSIVSFLKKNRIIPLNMYKFLIIGIGSKRNRILAPKVWQVYKMLIIDKSKLKVKLIDDGVMMYVYLGIYDPVIKVNKVKKEMLGLKSLVFELKKGHSILSEAFFEKTFKKNH